MRLALALATLALVAAAVPPPAGDGAPGSALASGGPADNGVITGASGRDDPTDGIDTSTPGRDDSTGDRVDTSTPGRDDSTDGHAAIASVYPNPVRDGDRGEFVVVALPPSPGTRRANWTLRDGETTIDIDASSGGRLALTPDPELIERFVDVRVRPVADVSLANAGERLVLARNGTVVDAVAYEDAPEGERFRPGYGFAPLGATDHPVARARDVPVTTFVLPDGAAIPVETIRSSSRRVLLAGYTLTSRRVARALLDAARRGVTVRVLVEGGPVGGVTEREARLLDRLVSAGISVRAVGGPRARVAFQHAKYAVVDDRALVASENWKPSGTGGNASRGWGAVVADPALAAHLAAVFEADAGWLDAIPWRRYRRGRSFGAADPATGDYPERFPARRLTAERVSVLVAPDNAERVLVDLLRGAEESVLVQQVSVGGRRTPLLREAVAAAHRGVRVRVLLSSAWYVREDNERLAAWLHEVAADDDLPLDVRLAEPRSRFEKVHNKGVIVDGEAVVVGSLNWNNHSLRENREVAVLLEGEAVAGYYERVFRADWRGGRDRVPLGLLAVVLALAVAAGRYGRRIDFEGVT